MRRSRRSIRAARRSEVLADGIAHAWDVARWARRPARRGRATRVNRVSMLRSCARGNQSKFNRSLRGGPSVNCQVDRRFLAVGHRAELCCFEASERRSDPSNNQRATSAMRSRTSLCAQGPRPAASTGWAAQRSASRAAPSEQTCSPTESFVARWPWVCTPSPPSPLRPRRARALRLRARTREDRSLHRRWLSAVFLVSFGPEPRFGST